MALIYILKMYNKNNSSLPYIINQKNYKAIRYAEMLNVLSISKQLEIMILINSGLT